jgi:hypothetical protein
MQLRTICLLVACAALVGCSRDDAVRCEPNLRYSTARSAQPVQIPDDLSPPNENDAIRLPPDTTVATTETKPGGCLESPPSFFRDEMPFQRRAGDEPEASAPPPSAPPPPAGDRVIDN